MSYWENELNKVELSAGQVSIQLKTPEQKTKWLTLTSDQYAAIHELLLEIEEAPEERVIFRKFPHDGAVIALFPDQYNERTGDINSYMELGQHAETAPHFGDTKPADYADYADLYNELVRQGYKNLKVVKRFGKLGRK